MNDLLRDLFAHNAWATRTLIDACQGLTEEQLDSSIPGSLGNIRETFEHYVVAESWYYYHLTRINLNEGRPEEDLSLTEIRERAEELAPRWQAFLNEPIDSERLIQATGDSGGRFEFTAGVVLAQIFNHANEHREQICAILTSIGIQPPDIDGWNYSVASGRGRRVSTLDEE